MFAPLGQGKPVQEGSELVDGASATWEGLNESGDQSGRSSNGRIDGKVEVRPIRLKERTDKGEVKEYGESEGLKCVHFNADELAAQHSRISMFQT